MLWNVFWTAQPLCRHGQKPDMHIVFINYNTYTGSSGVHIHFLANSLCALGVECTVVAPTLPRDPDYFGPRAYRFAGFARFALETALSGLPKGCLLHAWTPRENVRVMTSLLRLRNRAPYVVHLEDNEQAILEAHTGRSFASQCAAPERLRPGLPRAMIHPLRHQAFLEAAAGVTCIIKTLERFAPPGIPRLTFWPACEAACFELPPEPDEDARARLGIPKESLTLFYPGNIHPANVAEVESLYLALDLVAATGTQVTLLRCGADHARLSQPAQAARSRHVLTLGEVPSRELPSLVAAADLLVQPGRPGEFNDYRFPSKLPMFLASARPVILPQSNLGLELVDGVHCLHLSTDHAGGSSENLAACILRLAHDKALRTRLGQSGREFARRHFNWDASAARVLDFYRMALDREDPGGKA